MGTNGEFVRKILDMLVPKRVPKRKCNWEHVA